jgi:hypothetical protein
MKFNLRAKLAAEFVGSAFLVTAVIGSGIMGERLAGGNVAIALLANTIATGAALVALILTFGPISGISSGPLLRSINKAGRIWGYGFTPKVIWAIVKANAKSCGLPSVAPHDLRRTCARLCHQAGGELDQIQFLLGHVSIQTTERYLGCKQRFNDAVNDHIGLEPDAPS